MTPSEELIAATTATVTDKAGRGIVITKLKALDKLRLCEVVGAENVKNEVYYGYASLVFHVTSIDGETVAKPQTKLQLEALVQRLGDDGFDAVAQGVKDNFVPKAFDGEELKN